MKSAWTVRVYIRSEMPLTTRVLPMMELTFIIFGDEQPSKEVIESLASAHTRNAELIMSEHSFTPIPNDLLSDM